MSDLDRVLSQAMTLSAEERALLIDAIWATIPEDQLPPLEKEWMAEIRRRYANYQSGKEKSIPWEQARAMALERAGLKVPDASH